MNREERLIDCLNKLFKLKPVTYGEFNKIFKCDDTIFELEKEYSELGLAGEDYKGFSIISIMATITDFLCGKRFAVLMDNNEETDLPLENRIIKGVSLIDYRNKE